VKKKSEKVKKRKMVCYLLNFAFTHQGITGDDNLKDQPRNTGVQNAIPIRELFDTAQTSMRKWCRRDAQVVQTNMSVQNAIPIHELFDAAQTSMRKCVRRMLADGW
jgi:hypothetical protein